MLAGMVGLEPTNAGVKVPCLTAWLHPNIGGEKRKKRDWDLLPIPFFNMGWVMGLEPTTLGTTIRCSNQLSYTHHIGSLISRRRMARQKGLEPLAYCLEGSCSIQLSYWRIYGAGNENRTRIPSLEGWCPDHCAIPACTFLRFVSFVIIA